MKLIVNMVMGTVVAGLAEAMAMAEKVGLDQEDVAEVLSVGALSCPTVVHKSQGKSYRRGVSLAVIHNSQRNSTLSRASKITSQQSTWIRFSQYPVLIFDLLL